MVIKFFSFFKFPIVWELVLNLANGKSSQNKDTKTYKNRVFFSNSEISEPYIGHFFFTVIILAISLFHNQSP